MKTGEGRNGEMSHAQGRWPANLILDGSDEVVGLFPQAGGGFGKRGALNGGATQLGFDGHGQTVGYGDSGSAARFFKHFPTLSTNNTGSHMNTELADYLRTLISPEERTLTTTEGGECVYLHVATPDSFPWADHADASVHGLTVESSSLAGQPVWLPEAMRVLKPGAHLLLAAPDEEPTGHTGACIAEDAGFEVRDCILWVYGEGAGDRLHYTAKAARAEREAGCAALPLRTAAIEEDGDADDMGGESEPPKVSSVRNFHPTVKPVSLMRYLIRLLTPPGGVVLDRFGGSGSTAVAALEEGFAAITVEKTDDYLPIIEGRIRAALARTAAGVRSEE